MTTVVPEIRSQIGRSQPRRDAREKLRGEAQFVGDLLVPRMLHGKVLRSPIAHGRIASIDTSAAERLPGVVCVLTGADLHDIDPYYGHSIKDRPIVAIDKVRFHGEQVAAVAAETAAAAAAAVELIDVEYEELPVVADVAGAVADGAPLVTRPRVEAGALPRPGRAPAAGRQRLLPLPDRPRRARGGLRARGHRRRRRVHVPVRLPVRDGDAHGRRPGRGRRDHALGDVPAPVPRARRDRGPVRQCRSRTCGSSVPYLGGGFGSKSYTKMEPLTVALARKAGRPVRIQNRVAESMVTTRRHNMTCRMRTAATADGRLLARDVECLFDTGAYADNGPRVVATAGDAAPGPYRWAAYRVDAACVYTNLAPAGSYRAFGATHLQWIGESQVDEVARRAGLDPLDLRRENLCAPGEEVRAGGKPLDADLVGDVEKVAAGVGWGEEKDPLVGRGVSVGLLAAGAHPVSSAICRLEADGRRGRPGRHHRDGPGAADGIRADRRRGDRRRSRTGDGTRRRHPLQPVRPLDRSEPVDDASRAWPSSGQRRTSGRSSRRSPALHEIGPNDHLELMRKHFGFAGGELIGRGEVAPSGTGSYAEGPVFWEVCVGAAEIEVDADTGVVTVRKTATAADVGRAINPQLVERQDEGATLQGIGNALFEEMTSRTACCSTTPCSTTASRASTTCPAR